jgi:uncharacterized protein
MGRMYSTPVRGTCTTGGTYTQILQDLLPDMKVFKRIFAGELSGTTLITHGGPRHLQETYYITPGGACCSCILLTGALTRVESRSGESYKAWVADPTGSFVISTARQDDEVNAFLKKAEPPVFVLVTGEIAISQGIRKEVYVKPATIQPVDRLVRDTWIIQTADHTLRRLESMDIALKNSSSDPVINQAVSHYHMGHHQIRTLVVMVEEALLKAGNVPGGKIAAPDPREIVLDLIREYNGPKGVSISDLIPVASRMNIREEQVMNTIRQLVLEDECYQPAAGMIKLL